MNDDLSNKKIIEQTTETTTVTNNATPLPPNSNLNNGSSLPGSSFESHQSIPGGRLDSYETTSSEVLSSNSLPANETTVKTTTVYADQSCPTPPPMPPADFMNYGNTYSWPEESIPNPPPMPSSDFWRSGPSYSWPDDSNRSGGLSYPVEPVLLPVGSSNRTLEMLPVEIIEKPAVVHENIRQEQVEEIQPVVHVEREKTEIRQITQPLLDKEIKPVMVEERILPIEVLPTVNRDTGIIPESLESSTRTFEPTLRQVIEKTPIVQETEKWRIIEEVQPIIYKETIIPHIIRTSRPIREVIVEAPIFTAVTLPSRELDGLERERYSRFFNQELPIMTRDAPIVIPQAPVMPAVHKKEILEEKNIITTTTSSAPTLGAVGSNQSDSSRSTSSLVPAAGPAVINETHRDTVGPMGEKVHVDSITTSSSYVAPTRAV